MNDRELDALVAEKVMGWREVRMCPPEVRVEAGWDIDGLDPNYGGRDIIAPYSTDIAAAWEVVEKLMLSKRVEGIDIHVREVYEVVISGDWCGVAQADAAPRAICLAALRAVGMREVES